MNFIKWTRGKLQDGKMFKSLNRTQKLYCLDFCMTILSFLKIFQKKNIVTMIYLLSKDKFIWRAAVLCFKMPKEKNNIPTYKGMNFHMSIHLKISVLCSVLTNTDQSIPLCCQNVSWCLAGWLGLTKGRRNVKKNGGEGCPLQNMAKKTSPPKTESKVHLENTYWS